MTQSLAAPEQDNWQLQWGISLFSKTSEQEETDKNRTHKMQN